MSEGAKPPNYPVGYRKPPPEHQFKKGVSGNPNGRPRKKQHERVKSSATVLDDLLMAEAMRPIQIRENDRVIEIPMIQAVIRSLGVSAVKGSHRAQLALAQMVKVVQDQRFEERKGLFGSAVEYKLWWQEQFEEYDRRGLPRPEPVPHPDEVVLDSKTMEVKFNGPVGIDDKRHWDSMLARRQEALGIVAELKAALPDATEHTDYLEDDIAHEQRLADMIGGIIPDEKTRREPGFDIDVWREKKGMVEKLEAARRRRPKS